MTKLIQWLVLSSRDPKKLSLLVKGFLTMLVPAIIALTPLTDDAVNTVIDQIQVVIEQGLLIISIGMVVVGAIRKIWKTLAGTNEVIAEQDRGNL